MKLVLSRFWNLPSRSITITREGRLAQPPLRERCRPDNMSSCPACTYLNSPSYLQCEICAAPLYSGSTSSSVSSPSSSTSNSTSRQEIPQLSKSSHSTFVSQQAEKEALKSPTLSAPAAVVIDSPVHGPGFWWYIRWCGAKGWLVVGARSCGGSLSW